MRLLRGQQLLHVGSSEGFAGLCRKLGVERRRSCRAVVTSAQERSIHDLLLDRADRRNVASLIPKGDHAIIVVLDLLAQLLHLCCHHLLLLLACAVALVLLLQLLRHRMLQENRLHARARLGGPAGRGYQHEESGGEHNAGGSKSEAADQPGSSTILDLGLAALLASRLIDVHADASLDHWNGSRSQDADFEKRGDEVARFS
mmetsp:Transcript_22456/g.50602  ORF Transcript_22456/g.50602 Transcript_22456/m.50602 type:complete len:202 (+) Transcript_22456:1295-1900(+)